MKQIALLYPYSVPWIGDFILGVVDYARKHGDWDILTIPPVLNGTGEIAMSLSNLQGWPGDGVITAIANAAQIKIVESLRIPCVNLSGAMHTPRIPTVLLDNYAAGRLAAEHLLKCGFRRLAYHGIKKLKYSELRRQGFVDCAREAGVAVEVFDRSAARASMSWPQCNSDMVPWLKTLKTPIGIMALHDYRARAVITECQRLGMAVPHDVAVIGVDNDVTVCEYSRPTLSSVNRNGFRQGYEAARVLDRLMAGEVVGENPVLIPPNCVVARKSTETIAVENSHVANVVRYMHEHLGDLFGIKHVLRLVPVSRRRLEEQFQRFMQCTPYEYLSSIRVEKAKQLLLEPRPKKIKEIAKICGFSNPLQFRIVFKRHTGQSPRQFASLRGE
ncbi:MAG: DNA-binding transcriptional regulator [Pirellulales bacterium]|nr:DNA-binding transcriptional regulator [Pirellulales bacterium]